MTQTMSKEIFMKRFRGATGRVGHLSALAVAGNNSINTSAITDANENLNVSRTHYVNGDYEDAHEALILAEEQLDCA